MNSLVKHAIATSSKWFRAAAKEYFSPLMSICRNVSLMREISFRAALGAVPKRFFDITGSASSILALAPALLAIAIAVRMDGPPVIYRSRRIGRRERLIECYQFRTMVPDADAALGNLLDSDPNLKWEWLRHNKLRKDPRITKIGHHLRATGWDRLPRLWNVLRGDLSLVGPIPVVREELFRYGHHVSSYLEFRPGMTSLSSVFSDGEMNYRRRVVIEMYYIRNPSFLLDSYILTRSITTAISRSLKRRHLAFSGITILFTAFIDAAIAIEFSAAVRAAGQRIFGASPPLWAEHLTITAICAVLAIAFLIALIHSIITSLESCPTSFGPPQSHLPPGIGSGPEKIVSFSRGGSTRDKKRAA